MNFFTVKPATLGMRDGTSTAFPPPGFRTVPPRGFCSPASVRSNVLLPMPFPPQSSTHSPGPTANDRLRINALPSYPTESPSASSFHAIIISCLQVCQSRIFHRKSGHSPNPGFSMCGLHRAECRQSASYGRVLRQNLHL